MDKLRYKFKKIIRFINKILRLILIFGVLSSFFVFESSAAVYVDEHGLFDVIDGDYSMLESTLGIETNIMPSYTNYCIAYTVPSGFRKYEYLTFNVEDENFSNRLSAGNLVILKGQLCFRGSPNSSGLAQYLVDNDCSLRIVLYNNEKSFVLANLNRPLLYTGKADKRTYACYDFDITFTIPEDFDFYTNNRLAFVLSFEGPGDTYFYDPDTNGILLYSDSIDFYVGDRENAPLYIDYDSNIAADVRETEDALITEAGGGLDETRSYIGIVQSIFESGGPLISGLQFISMFFNDLQLNWSWLNNLFVISLALGSILVVFGVSSLISKRR